MKTHTPALTASALAAAASKKTAKVQRQLIAAEAELQSASAALMEALPAGAGPEVKTALEHNVAAEEKVHEAAEDLEAVKDLLSDAVPDRPAAEHKVATRLRRKPAAGKSGEGAKSLMSHLRRHG